MALPPLTRQSLRGIWGALITTWTADDRLDEKRFAAEVRAYASSGVQGVYTGGTTGEFYTQDDATFERITAIACEASHAVGVRIQAGCTALSTRTAKQRIAFAKKCGADAIQIALPFWLQLKDDEAAGFFHDVAQAAYPTPLILYHTSRAKYKFNPAQIGELAAKIPTFIGTKDGGCEVAALREMVKLAPDLAIFGGEHDMVERIGAGGHGAYSSVSGLTPHATVRLYELCAAGKFAEAAPLQKAMYDVLFSVAIPWVTGPDGLFDSAVDRILRIVGGGDVDIRCQLPYRSGTQKHVDELRAWCKKNAPYLIDKKLPMP
jgi:dihydrodipicolinate synthase/N-acetylneuraminate lyase